MAGNCQRCTLLKWLPGMNFSRWRRRTVAQPQRVSHRINLLERSYIQLFVRSYRAEHAGRKRLLDPKIILDTLNQEIPG